MNINSLLSQAKPDGDCLVWQGRRLQTKGFDYGVVRSLSPFPHSVGRKSGKAELAMAHRLAWSLAHDRPIPAGMYICHHCDRPSCVNPAHLFLGTPQDNMDDAKRKGRIWSPGATCRRGHSEWRINPNGERTCKACHRENAASARAKAKARVAKNNGSATN